MPVVLWASCGAAVLIGGCAGPPGLYDPHAIERAQRVAVLPGVGAPGLDGPGAGQMEASLVITSLARMRRFAVEGPARLRKAMGEEATSRPAGGRDLQADAARKLGIDLLVLPDVTDYRFTKEWKSRSWLVASSERSRSDYWAAVSVRIVAPGDGRLVYAGSGQGQSDQGYGPAVRQATEAALAELRQFAASRRAAE